MDRSDRVGRGLVQRLLRRGDETDLTDHLAHLLRVPELGRVFLRLIQVEPAESEIIGVDAQIIDPETRDRPDLALTTSNTTVWVDAKLDAALTPNQPLGYLRCLGGTTAEKKHLVFITKSRRWRELCSDIRAAVGLAEDYARTFLHQNIPVTVCTWREVRDCLAHVELQDPVAAYLRDEFTHHIDDHIERMAIPLTPEMIPVLNDPNVLRAFAALEDLVTDVMEHLEQDGHLIRHQEKGELRQHGFFVASKGDQDRRLDLWIGIVSRAGVVWPGKGPLWAWLFGEGWDEAA